MIDFNENPFKKDTAVTPFSNGSDADYWHENNCERCINYESESQQEEDAKCKLAYHIDLGFVAGTIPLWVAKEIGCDYEPLYAYVRLAKECRKYRNGTEPF